MAATTPRPDQVRGYAGAATDFDVCRTDLRTAGAANTNVIAKALQGTGISLSSSGFDAGTGDVTIALAVPVAVANGGTGATTALAARGPSGLNIESRATMANTNRVGTATDNYIGTTTTAFTAQRTYFMPAANSQNPGEKIYIGDDGGAINGANNLLISPNAGDTIHGGTASITLLSARSSIVLATDGVSNWTTVQRSPSVRTQILTSGTTFTTTVGAKAMWVECIGGGGGGGGALGTATPTCMSSGGGAGGSYAAIYILNPKTSYTYSIGTGGAVGAATGTPGGAGAATSFDSPSVCTAQPGNGGGSGNAAATGPVQSSTGGSASLSTVGDVLITGSDGTGGLRWSGSAGASGAGGAAARGGGAVKGVAGAGNGNSGWFPGGGGSGALSASTTGQTGGIGAAGCIIVTEYF